MKELDIKEPMHLVEANGDAFFCVSNVIFTNEEQIFCEVRHKDWTPQLGDKFSYMLFDRASGLSFLYPTQLPDGLFHPRYQLENYQSESYPEATMTLSERARETARSGHLRVGQMYDDKPYIFHVDMAADVGRQFKHLIPENDFETVLAGIYLHDAPEDIHFVTYNPLKAEFGEHVAEIAFALENEKGRNRKARANDKYYQGIRDVKYAAFAKCCDRIANIKHGVQKGGGHMLDGYRKEHTHFKKQLFTEELAPMFEEMETLLAQPAYTL